MEFEILDKLDEIMKELKEIKGSMEPESFEETNEKHRQYESTVHKYF